MCSCSLDAGASCLSSLLPLLVRMAGKRLRGVDAQRMDALSARVAVERQQYADEQWNSACANKDMYNYVAPAARDAMEARTLVPCLRSKTESCNRPHAWEHYDRGSKCATVTHGLPCCV